MKFKRPTLNPPGAGSATSTSHSISRLSGWWNKRTQKHSSNSTAETGTPAPTESRHVNPGSGHSPDPSKDQNEIESQSFENAGDSDPILSISGSHDKSLPKEDSVTFANSLERTTSPRRLSLHPVGPGLSTGNGDGEPHHDKEAEQTPRTIGDVWSEAYDKLKKGKGTEKLMDTYEKILSCPKLQKMMAEKPNWDPHSEIDIDAKEHFSNDFESLHGNERVKKMQLIAERGLDKMEKQGSSKATAGVGRVIRLIDKSQDFISSALKNCESASLAWAGVCLIVLPAVVNGFDQLDKRREGLDYVNNRIKWYTGLHELLLLKNWNQKDGPSGFDRIYHEVEEEVCELYRYLIEYQVKCVCTLFANLKHEIINTIRNILVLDDWEGRLTKITEFEVRLEKRANTCLNFEARKDLSDLVMQGKDQINILSNISVAVKDLLEIEERRMIEETKTRGRKQIALFDDTQYETILAKISDGKEGSRDWLLNHNNFLKWEASDGGLLVIEANPGRGKSVLAKSILKRLEGDKTKMTCYFFNGGVKSHNKTTTAFCAVLHQLFTRKEEILHALGDDIEKKKESFTNDIEALWALFDSPTKKCKRGEITCIFDALDKCKPSCNGGVLWDERTLYSTACGAQRLVDMVVQCV